MSDPKKLGDIFGEGVEKKKQDDGRRQVVLVKNGHRYTFCYKRGEETKVLSAIVDMAKDPKIGLDWFDAAVLSFQMDKFKV